MVTVNDSASSLSVSSVDETVNVVELSFALRVTVPEEEPKSEEPSPIAHASSVSISPTVPAVTVYVTLPPSSTEVAEEETVTPECGVDGAGAGVAEGAGAPPPPPPPQAASISGSVIAVV